MVNVVCNAKLVYKVVIWAFFGISLWKEKVALNYLLFCHGLVRKQWKLAQVGAQWIILH